MQSVNAIYICNLYMQFIYAINICNPYMQSIYIYAVYICNIYICNPYMLYNIYICNLYRQHIDLINAIYIYICNLYIYAIYKMPIFAIPYVRTTFCNPECWKYTFSLCNNDILQYRMLKIYIFLMKYWHFGPANARREAGGRQPGNRADRDPAECKK